MSAVERLAAALHDGAVIQCQHADPYPGEWPCADAVARLRAADPTLLADLADGAALRRLREALPEGATQSIYSYTVRGEPVQSVGFEYRVGPRRYRRAFGEAPTIAQAADAARAQIEAGS